MLYGVPDKTNRVGWADMGRLTATIQANRHDQTADCEPTGAQPVLPAFQTLKMSLNANRRVTREKLSGANL